MTFIPWRKALLLHHPNIQNDAVEVLPPLWRADEKGVVQPGIRAVGRSLELWSALEVERGLSRLVFAV